MATICKRTIPAVLLFLVTAVNIVFGQASEETLLNYSCSVNQDGASCAEFNGAMKHREVQGLLLQIAGEPRTREFVDDALRGTGMTASALEDLRLIRRNGNRYVLAFFLYTKADLDTLRAVAEPEGRTLAAAFLARRDEMMTILKRDSLPGDDLKALAYFLVGCVSLDWDGLNFTQEKGYRTEGPVHRDVREPGGGGNVRELYWGSHNWHEDIATTSFGDHASGPRYALPDLRFTVDAPPPLKSNLQFVAGMLVRRHAGTIMLALRDGPKDKSHLAAATGLNEEDTNDILKVLLQLHYIAFDGKQYRAIIPVLSERDAPMVQDLRRLGREVIAGWFAQHHAVLERQLGDLTAVRQGVPLSDGYYWVWHYLFGVANRELVAAGLFADPYAPERAFKGFIPAVYPRHIVMGQEIFR